MCQVSDQDWPIMPWNDFEKVESKEWKGLGRIGTLLKNPRTLSFLCSTKALWVVLMDNSALLLWEMSLWLQGLGERTALCFQDIFLKVVESDTWSSLTGIERDVPVVYGSACVHRSLDFTPGGLLNSLVYCSSTVSVLGRGWLIVVAVHISYRKEN